MSSQLADPSSIVRVPYDSLKNPLGKIMETRIPSLFELVATGAAINQRHVYLDAYLSWNGDAPRNARSSLELSDKDRQQGLVWTMTGAVLRQGYAPNPQLLLSNLPVSFSELEDVHAKTFGLESVLAALTVIRSVLSASKLTVRTRQGVTLYGPNESYHEDVLAYTNTLTSGDVVIPSWNLLSDAAKENLRSSYLVADMLGRPLGKRRG